MEIHVYGSINIAHANSLYRRKSRGLFTRYAFKREGGRAKQPQLHALNHP